MTVKWHVGYPQKPMRNIKVGIIPFKHTWGTKIKMWVSP